MKIICTAKEFERLVRACEKSTMSCKDCPLDSFCGNSGNALLGNIVEIIKNDDNYDEITSFDENILKEVVEKADLSNIDFLDVLGNFKDLLQKANEALLKSAENLRISNLNKTANTKESED